MTSKVFRSAKVPKFDGNEYPKGTKDLLTELGPEKFCNWLQKRKENSLYRYNHA
jgi:pyruvate carboxylase